MTPKQKAVIDAAKSWDNGIENLCEALRAQYESEEPEPVVFPDLPTDHTVWQHVRGYTTTPISDDAYDAVAGRNPEWRKLHVTYTIPGGQSPAERIAELEQQVAEAKGDSEYWSDAAVQLDQRKRISDMQDKISELSERVNCAENAKKGERIAILEKETDVLLVMNGDQRARIEELEAELGKLRPVFEQAARMVHAEGLFQGGFGGTVAGQIADLILDAQDDSALLWGVLDNNPPNTHVPLVIQCHSEKSARLLSGIYKRRRVVRLRVIEVPE